MGDINRALPHYQDAIRYTEATGNYYQAGQFRFNVALALAQNGRFPDARDYAAAALRNYEQFGPAAADMVEKTQRLLAEIEELAGS